MGINMGSCKVGVAYDKCATESDGLMANLQIYNATLTSGDINAIYLSGIGGAPSDLNHLIAWYPLNGNLNDYSGYGYNLMPYNAEGGLYSTNGIQYTAAWEGNYTAP